MRAQVFDDKEVQQINADFNEGKAEVSYDASHGVNAQAEQNLLEAQIKASEKQKEKDEKDLKAARDLLAEYDQYIANFAKANPTRYTSGATGLLDASAAKRAGDAGRDRPVIYG